ncbi:hypothetical protein SOM12_22455 [Flavobacterium sp. CFBP9031]|uniref:hypothetical protein n=1 Tax=Flavobacterium sp. CFBP9031 TaxID=3096538 RepID=UPI002A69CE3D|nr:hypothetical protein [Flavobacterium sp. CFBP9031]MDY0990208.1 hypothetical protein [Flavobacterium sp. CFBP9031]
MEVISGEEFQTMLYSNVENTISSFIVESSTPLNIDLEKVDLFITFSNLEFKGKNIHFNNHKKECIHRFRFEKCLFESNVFIESSFDDLSFISNTFNCDKFHISKSNINVLEFTNDEFAFPNIKPNIFKKGNFNIYNCNFNSIFWLKNVQFIKGASFDISSVNFNDGFYFDSISLDQIVFYNCNFSNEFRCDSLYNNAQFRECTFSSLTNFISYSNSNLSFLNFESCNFLKLTKFNNYHVHSLRLEDTTFSDKVSFQESNFDIIKIERSIFEKTVWFDGIQINQFYNCDRKTLRIIKRELASSHNQIDYLRFKAYELKAYKSEVDKNNLNRKDALILYFNEESNNFGLDWTKGLFFIFQWSYLFYIFYIISYSYYVTDINCIPKIDTFLVNYLKFLNPFSFLKAPIEDSENYFLPFLFFMFGKIFISFGIYQTVQAFRKFGVNGG